MQIRSLLSLTLVIFYIQAFSQVVIDQAENTCTLRALSPQEEMQLRSLPELRLPPGYGNRDLPYTVDNSTQIYMRPVFNQDQYCCGQAAAIGYNFTYEMDRARNLDASLPENQYPTHFSWNFMNGGNGWYGVSYLHSLQILKEYGMPNVVDYGGTLSYGGPTRWMSGYQEYLNGMHNRIMNSYQIQVGTPEGLQVLKYWIHDHLDSSAVGGVASFYAQYMSADHVFPPGTPEAGKHVLTTFGGSANHAMTIVGYNDSIRWDYNNDGQYTNNIDINGDGDVDMKDWEIGGFKMVQSYGGVPNWGDQGYAYMMYKTVADDLGNGGIWNHCVHVVDTKPTYEPLLTARIILKHSCRRMIKVITGISNNTASENPEHVLDFPIFDFQGGDFYMQGGSTEEDKTIEFGLDLSKLLTYANLNQNIKVFLQVIEDDPEGTASGTIIHYSIFDYTNGNEEITCPQSNVPLLENDTTTLSITHNFNFSRVEIQDQSLPAAPPGQFYSHQMVAENGTLPYAWDLDKHYSETSRAFQFPQITATQLYPGNNSGGFVTQQLQFAFPFYDSSYTSVTVHVDGYLMFDEQLYPFPYFDDDQVLFNISRNISPCMNWHQVTSSGGGLWYDGDANSATFRWKTSIEGTPSYVYNYAVRLYPDGKIEFYYGSMNGSDYSQWISGISDGDNENFQETAISDKPVVSPDKVYELNRYQYPPEMSITKKGLFSGIPQQAYGGTDITFKVTDNNFISAFKTLTFSSNGIVINDSINSGGDETIEFGETANMSVMVTNIQETPVTDAFMTISIDDDYITVTDNTEDLGILIPGQPVIFPDAFHFQVSPDIPDDHLFTIHTEITTPDTTWESDLIHRAYAPIVQVLNVWVADTNSRLDPGDTANVVVTFLNNGGADVYNLYTLLTTTDPNITINSNLGIIPFLNSGTTQSITFNVTISPDVMNGHVANFIVDMTGESNYSASDSFSLVIGFNKENFETGDFSLIDWGFGGNRDWMIDNEFFYDGSFSARSGFISHNMESSMMVDMIIHEDGDISFYRKVSCEDDPSVNNNYDYLAFFVDGIEKGRWDGEQDWTYSSYPVIAGFHRFEWRYHKDGSISRGRDGAWLDCITFPPPEVACPDLLMSVISFEAMMRPDEVDYDTLTLTNSGQGDLNFEIFVSSLEPARLGDPPNRSIGGAYLVTPAEYFNTGQEYTWSLNVYNPSPDNEWLKELYLEFPAGIEITTASDFIGGSGGPMAFLGPFGNGVTVTWHGQDANNWGVVHGGENASADITVTIYETLLQDVDLNYEIYGDVYGGLPHVVQGSIPLRNLGTIQDWLTLDTLAGILGGGASRDILLQYNTTGLANGTYHSYLIMKDHFNPETLIPVSLTVDDALDVPVKPMLPGSEFISIFPNPFRGEATLLIRLDREERVGVRIYNSEGILVACLTDQERMMPGNHIITWNGKDDNGSLLQPGIYFCETRAGEYLSFKKIVLLAR
jgi:hypothetical protein